MKSISNIQRNVGNYQNSRQTVLPVMEQFYTLQGEGIHTGKASTFLRLAGCDVGCFWCDVKESWPLEAHPDKSVEQIVEDCLTEPSEIVVVTGGEPLMYNLEHLTTALQEAGLKTHIETSGAYALTGTWDWICLSPKKFKEPVSEVLPLAHELKIIIYNKSDFAWAEKYAAEVSENCELLLQVEWSKREQMLPQLVEYVKANPQWKISLQTHKYLDIP